MPTVMDIKIPGTKEREIIDQSVVYKLVSVKIQSEKLNIEQV